MTIWKNCTADIYYSDDKPELRDPGYEVRLKGDELVISYQSDGCWVNYKGLDQGGWSLPVDCRHHSGPRYGASSP